MQREKEAVCGRSVTQQVFVTVIEFLQDKNISQTLYSTRIPQKCSNRASTMAATIHKSLCDVCLLQSDSLPRDQPQLVDSGVKDKKLVTTITPTDDRGGRGFQMAQECPLVYEWADSFDGEHPLMDIGCAFGSNIEAAVQHLNEQGKEIKILAADFSDVHLHAVDQLGIEGVKTVYCKLPTPISTIKPNSVSGILLSEVFHFLTGEEIEATLRWCYDILVPGGKVFVTAMTAYCMDHPIAEHIRSLYKERVAKGTKWPLGSGCDIKGLTVSHGAKHGKDGMQEVFRMDSKSIDALPNYLHQFGDNEELQTAFREANFQVLLSKYSWRDGYPEAFKFDDRESIQIMARKPSKFGTVHWWYTQTQACPSTVGE